MKVETLKELEKVINLCRKTGINHIIVDGIEMHLGHLPDAIEYKAPKAHKTLSAAAISPGVAYSPGEDAKITTDDLTDEQLLFYSAASNEETES